MSRRLPLDAWVLVAALVLFAGLGAARLNPFCLFEPDTPEYLFTSRALGELRGYLEIDHVGEPPHTFRPPGLPLLLVPLSWVRPYHVVAAKGAALALALGMLALVWLLARRISGPLGAGLALALVATSPYTLLHATEVVSEVPFVLGSLGLLWLVCRARRGPPTWTEVGAAAALLAFLPLLRMVGIALGGALALWALVRPERRRWIVAAVASGASFLLWAWRCGAAGGPTYFGAIRNKLAGGGVSALAAMAGDSLRFYLGRFAQVLLPGVFDGQPVYERLLLEGAPSLGGLHGLGLLAGLVAVALAIHGAGRRREEGGTLVLLYAVLTFVILAIYPPRHERLVWPLVPLVWIFATAGLPRAPRPARLAAAAAAGVVIGWQLLPSWQIVRANAQWRREGAAFYAERVPPMYFADWQSAGAWIAAHAPPSARVLTRHSDVGFTARRYQESVRFEETSPADWRRALAKLHARYLAVPTTLFGRLFPAEALIGDPVYTLAPVHESGDVRILEVRPNRTGQVSAEAGGTDGAIESCRRAVARFPDRAELRVRLAEMLADRGRTTEAVALLRERTGPATARNQLALGELLLRADDPAAALAALQGARSLPEADLLERRIRRAITRAQESLPARGGQDSVDALLARAAWDVEVLRYGDALAAVERAHRMAPSHPEVLRWHGELLQRLGRLDEAEAALEAARRAGHPDAERKLQILRGLRAVDASTDPAFVLGLAQAVIEDGTPGKALDLLERAQGRFPTVPEVRQLLADLYLFYGDAERSADLYRSVLAARPGDPRASQGLAACAELARQPRL